ncbi:MAG: hypothetical protein H0X52_00435 [Gemmatimonadetes bacterium]|nr:hypothetical protein [Gemmatimonadota bacterium]
MKQWVYGLMAVLLLTACGANDDAGGESQTAGLPAAEQPDAPAAGAVCSVAAASRPLPDDVHESSGVAVSRQHAGIFWTHNDSGDPIIHAINVEGQSAGRVRVTGARVEDWEDIALAPCPGGDCLYIADIGDNNAKRPSITVYRVPEPTPGDAQTRPAEALQASYPDGAHDAEAMFVHNGQIYILTKGETGPVALYRFPASAQPGQTSRLERVREFASNDVKRKERITGADASPDGRWIAVRTLRNLALYPAADFVGSGEQVPREMDLKELKEAQGEGIGFAPDGALVLTSEGGKKKDPATFARLTCTLD